MKKYELSNTAKDYQEKSRLTEVPSALYGIQTLSLSKREEIRYSKIEVMDKPMSSLERIRWMKWKKN